MIGNKLTQRIVFLLLLTTTACSGQPPLSGTITFAEDSEWSPMVYLIAPGSWRNVASNYVGNVIDSARVDTDGHFAFKAWSGDEEPLFLQLAVQRKEERFLNRLDNDEPPRSNYFPLVWQKGETIVVNAEAERLQQTVQILEPSTVNADLLALRDLRMQAYDQYLSREHDHEDLLAGEAQLLAFQEQLFQFAAETQSLLPALLAIRWASIEGNYERLPELLVAQAERWQAAAPSHPWVQELAQVGDRRRMPALIGDLFPDYPMPLLTGDTTQLQSLLGARLTLVDLWASWCGPCRLENREFLVPLWKDQHEQGFQIIGYGLEASERSWQRAIEQDGVQHWPHASDLMGDDSPLFEQLRITTIPANYLLDEEGRVVAKNLHGEELVSFVQAFLSN